MNIALSKFGSTLVSRQIGKEAYTAFQSSLIEVSADESIIVDFKGVITFSPSWGGEFLLPLFNKYGNLLILKKTQNPSVLATLDILEKIHKIKFNIN